MNFKKPSSKFQKGISIVYILFIIFTILHFTVPFTHEYGSIPNVRFSYTEYSAIDLGQQKTINVYFFDYVYLIGHYTCHQLSERSYYLNDNQIPVCSRCLGIYLGMSFVFIIALRRHPSGSFFQSLHELALCNIHSKSILCDIRIIIFIGVIFSIPMLTDVSLQIFTPYLSNNLTRLITGFFFGLVEGGFIVGFFAHFEYIIGKRVKLFKINSNI